MDCSYFDDSRTALYDAISKMVTEAGADDDEPVAFSMQQLSRDAQWQLLTGGLQGSITDESVRRRVTARVLASIGEWALAWSGNRWWLGWRRPPRGGRTDSASNNHKAIEETTCDSLVGTPKLRP